MTANSLLKTNTVPLKEWMTAILNVTKKQIHYFKGWMAAIRLVGGEISRLPLKKLNA